MAILNSNDGVSSLKTYAIDCIAHNFKEDLNLLSILPDELSELIKIFQMNIKDKQKFIFGYENEFDA